MLSLLFLAKPTGFLFQINVSCGSRAEVVIRPILLPDSVERVLEPGANFAKIFTPWSRLH